jgi:predicted GIY-YIG superfamily endonuclease
MGKLNPYKRYDDSNTAHLQVAFLTRVLKLAWEKIAEITGYALSTIRKLYYKMKDSVEAAKRLFSAIGETIEEEVDKVKTYFSKYDDCIQWDVIPTDKPCGYVLEFWDNGKLLFLKVGMTTDIRRRVKEHLRNYNSNAKKRGTPYTHLICKVKMIYEAINADNATIIESALRDFYKTNYKDTFVRQDRFMGVPYQEREKSDTRFCSFLSLATAAA